MYDFLLLWQFHDFKIKKGDAEEDAAAAIKSKVPGHMEEIKDTEPSETSPLKQYT